MQIITDVIDQISHNNQTQETKFDEILNRELAKILAEMLNNTDDIQAAMVSSVDGLARAKISSTEMDQHRFAAMSSALLALSDSLIKEGQQGRTENVLIEGSNGKIFILHASPKLLLTVFTTSGANFGMSLAFARQATEQINALVEALS